jgi:hypothetical protein
VIKEADKGNAVLNHPDLKFLYILCVVPVLRLRLLHFYALLAYSNNTTD